MQPAVASIVLASVGLTLIAAYLFMAANFDRNVDAGLDKLFTRLALAVAALSASAAVVGVVETIEVRDLAVTIVMLGIAVLVALTLVGSLYLSRIPCLKAKRQEQAGADRPEGIDDAIERTHISKPSESMVEGNEQEQVDEEQNGAADGEVAQPLAETSKGRDGLRWAGRP